MQIKKLKLFSMVIILTLSIFTFATPGASWGPWKGWCKPRVPSEDEMFGWIEDMWEIGINGRYGYRMPGTHADLLGAQYTLEKFEEAGLEDAFMEPVPADLCFPDEWNLTVHSSEGDEEISSYFLRYVGFTDEDGVTAPLVYVGAGSEEDFEGTDVEGKIVLVDILGAPWAYTGFLENFVLYEYDPDGTFGAGEMATENWPLANLESSYSLARDHNAAGFVGIMTVMAHDVNQYLHWYGDGSIPGLTVSPDDGDYLKDMLATEPIDATIILTGEESEGVTYNVYGTLPGKTDDVIVLETHHDGWATNEASGTAVVIALANYFAQIPKCKREKTMQFVSFASHFGNKAPWDEYDCLAYDTLPKVACAINIEMISKHIKVIDGEFVETGLVAPRGMFLTGPFMSANEHLLSYAIEAIEANDMERTFCLPAAFAVPGEGAKYANLGIPTVNYISHNPPQFTYADTPDTVAKEEFVPTTMMFIDMIKDIDVTPSALLKWTEMLKGGPIAGNPNIEETVWQMTRAPWGPYDKIGLRRVSHKTLESKGVVFLLPGTWSNGEQLVHVRKNGVQHTVPNENHSILHYLANRGFEVYTIDYRTHFVPHTELDHSFMINWGWEAWIGDMKEAVNLMKEYSGVSKVFIAGESFGGGAAMNYAAMYGDKDLKGIILLDGGIGSKYGGETNTYDLPQAIEDMVTAGEYSRISRGGPNNPVWGDAILYPDIPSPVPGYDTLKDYLLSLLYASGSANPYSYPWSEFVWEALFAVLATFDPYWPALLSLESSAYRDWTNCPYLEFDYDDHYIDIDIPLLGFLSKHPLSGDRYFVHGIANPDFTGYVLEGYGHLDMYVGTFIKDDINHPTYLWLSTRKMLVGYGRARIGHIWLQGETTIYLNENVIDYKIGGVRLAWDIISQRSHWNYDSYRGSSDLGKITVVIFKRGFSFAHGRKIYFGGYRV